MKILQSYCGGRLEMHENPANKAIYIDFIGQVGSPKSKIILNKTYYETYHNDYNSRICSDRNFRTK
jgi:hypothetical protein